MASSTKTYPDPITQIETMDRPWDRLKGEPARAYARFQFHIGTSAHIRSLENTAENSNCSLSVVQGDSSQWKWTKRAQAWDNYIQKKAEELAVTQRAERLEAHSNMIQAYQKVGMSLVKEFSRRIGSTTILQDLSDKDLMKEMRLQGPLVKDLIQLERLINNEANEIHQVNHSHEVIVVKPEPTGEYDIPAPPPRDDREED